MAPIIPVILSGGAGKRLWPLSTMATPKQFLPIWEDGGSLFEATLKRLVAPGFAPPVVIGSASQHAMIERSAARAGVTLGGLLLEPMPRDSAAAIAAATCWVAAEIGSDAVIAVLPSDHRIPDPASFQHAVRCAARIAADGHVVTIGIAPDRPAPEYGYIERGAPLPGHADAFTVTRFKEKPTREAAAGYLAAGCFDWNAGMFFFRADVFADEAEQHMPDIRRAADRAVAAAERSGIGLRLDPDFFAAARATSIDYALLEASSRVAVLRAGFSWSDVGNWRSVHDVLANGAAHNFVEGDARATECKGSLVIGSGIPVRVLGLDGVGVIATPEGVLVVPLERAAEIKDLLG